MTCMLFTCAHAQPANCRPSGHCGASFVLELSKRNDGYLCLERENPAVESLVKDGLVTATKTGGGCIVVRAVKGPSQPYHHARREIAASPAAKIGQGIKLAEETFA